MEKVFRARTSKKGGVFIDGVLIDKNFRIFKSDSLYDSCLRNGDVEDIEVFDGRDFSIVRTKVREDIPPVREVPDDFESMTVAEIKVYLIDKGFEKKDVADLNKKDLIQLARGL